jgi:acylphosphatase
MKEFLAIVSGRVQMVMYRDFVERHARRYGVTGTVRNLAEGTVEVVAQGEAAALEKLLRDLHKGPLLAKVADVNVTWRDPQQKFDSFLIVQ